MRAVLPGRRQGSQPAAAAAIRELIDAYHARTPTELDLVGRIVGLLHRRDGQPQVVGDARTVRRQSAALPRQRRHPLPIIGHGSEDAGRAESGAGGDARRPPPVDRRRTARPEAPVPPLPQLVAPRGPRRWRCRRMRRPRDAECPPVRPVDIDAMKRDARTLMAAFSRDGASGSVSPPIPDTATMVRAAARAAVAAATRPPAA